MKLKNIDRKKWVWVVLPLICIVFVCLYIFMTSSDLKLSKQRDIEINSAYDYSQLIEEVKNGSVADVKIDSSQVDVKNVGEYNVIFEYKGEKQTIKVRVVDTTSPQFEVQETKVAVGQQADPNALVKDIKDASKTKVYFEKDYSFDKEGEQNVNVVVEDSSHNKTVKETKVIVIKDTTPPKIIASNASVLVNSEVVLEDLVSLEDDFDKKPTLIVNKGNFDSTQLGNYEVTFLAKDASGNEASKTIIIQVIDKTGKNEKVVYLTFDDGPSKYTPQVLDILDQYNCKATFFITGMNASYRKYITIAHDKGHTIGLHTYSHKYSQVYASTDNYFSDLEKIGNLAKDYIGYVPKYIRFPGGSSNAVSKRYCKGIMTKLTKMVEEKGYIYYDWNAENGDGYSNMTKKEMLRRATLSNSNQIMLLMHDANGKQNTVDILPAVIEHYQKKGYTFKAIDDSSMVPHQPVNN